MTNNTAQYLKDRVYLVHDWLIRAGEVVSNDEFVHVFSKNAPPIGWHLWHMTRFSDRLQSKLASVTADSPTSEIWYRDKISTKWGLLPEKLGVFESGMGQAHRDAQATIAEVGQSAIINYAKMVCESCNDTIRKLAISDFERRYNGILDYGYDGTTGNVWATEAKETIVGQDLIFHASHGSRHMGMMEALRGLLDTAGTLSV